MQKFDAAAESFIQQQSIEEQGSSVSGAPGTVAAPSRVSIVQTPDISFQEHLPSQAPQAKPITQDREISVRHSKDFTATLPTSPEDQGQVTVQKKNPADDSDMYTALVEEKPDTFRKMLDSNIDVLGWKTDSGVPLAECALDLGCGVELLHLLLDRGQDPNVIGSERIPIFAQAIEKGSMKQAMLLLEKGASTKCLTSQQTEKLLKYAVKENCLEKLRGKVLIPKEMSQAHDAQNLFRALEFTDLHALQKLISNGANLDIKDESGRTALQVALEKKDAGIVEALLKGGCKVDSQNLAEEILKFALACRNSSIFSHLILQNTIVPANRELLSDCLYAAFKSGDREVVQKLVESGVDLVQLSDHNASTLLHAACESANPSFVKFALDDLNLKSLINRPDASGKTPIFAAVGTENEALIGLMLDKGASVNVRDADGHLPIDRANKDQTICLLLQRDPTVVDVKQTDAHGRTFLHIACETGFGDVADALMARGADVMARCNKGCTPLHSASSPQIAATLLNKGASLDAKDHNGETPLHSQALSCRTEIVQLLLANGAKAASLNNRGQTPLHTAGNHSVVDLLLGAGLDINAKDHIGRAPLHAACERNNALVAGALIAKSAQITPKDSLGCTPLDRLESLPASENVQTLSQLLTSHGARSSGIKAVAAQYATPLSLAPPVPVLGINNPRNEANRQNIVKFLNEHDPEVQPAIGAMIEATDYVSFDEFQKTYDTCVIDELNKRIQPGEKYIVVVEPKKSNKWLAELALHKLKTPPMNAVTLDQLKSNLSDVDRIVFFDDASYSGEQMCRFITKATENIKDRKNFTITVAIPYMTTWAEQKLEATKTPSCNIEILPHKTMRQASSQVDSTHHIALTKTYFPEALVANLLLMTKVLNALGKENMTNEDIVSCPLHDQVIKDVLAHFNFSEMEGLRDLESAFSEFKTNNLNFQDLDPEQLLEKIIEDPHIIALTNKLAPALLAFYQAHEQLLAKMAKDPKSTLYVQPFIDCMKAMHKEHKETYQYEQGLQSRTLTVFDHKVADNLSTCPGYQDGEVYENGAAKTRKPEGQAPMGEEVDFEETITVKIFPGNPPYKTAY